MSTTQGVGAQAQDVVAPDDGRFHAEPPQVRKNLAARVIAVVVLVLGVIGCGILAAKHYTAQRQMDYEAKKREKAEEAKAEARRNSKPFARSGSAPSPSPDPTSATEGTGRTGSGEEARTSSLPVGFGASSPTAAASPIPLKVRTEAPATPSAAPNSYKAPAAAGAAASAPRVPSMVAVSGEPSSTSSGPRTEPSTDTGEQRLAAYKARMDALQAQAASQAAGGGPAAGLGSVGAAGERPSSVTSSRRGRTVQEYAQLATMRNPATATPQVAAANLGDRGMLLARGAVIPCVLLTQVHSNVPGAASCQVSEDIWSDDGRVLLIGRGSTIAGAYPGGVRNGDSRMAIVWSRIKSADGIVIDVESPGGDGVGTMGLGGFVDNHWPERIGAALLLSLIDDAVSIEVASRSDGNASRTPTSTANTTKSMSEQVLSTTINIPPTITKPRGSRVAVLVQRDLWFDGVYSVAKR